MLGGRALSEETLARPLRAWSARVSTSLTESPRVLRERPIPGMAHRTSKSFDFFVVIVPCHCGVELLIADYSLPTRSLP